MADQVCTELPGTVLETYSLVFELVGYEAKNGPAQLVKVLQSPKVQAKIKESLEKRIGALQKKAQGRPIDSQQALQEIKSVFTVDALDVSLEELKKEVEQSAKYRQLKSSLDDMSCKFKKAPFGFFYDEAAGIMVVVVSGMMLAGAAAIYVAQTGDADTLTAIAAKVAEKALEFEVAGKITIGVTDVELKVSEKKYDAGIFARVSKWKFIDKAEVKVTVQTKDEKVAAVPIAVETRVGIAPNWFQSFGAGYEPMKKELRFSLGIMGEGDKFKVQVNANYLRTPEKQEIGGKGDFTYKPLPNLGLSAGLGVSRIDQVVPNPVPLTGPPNIMQQQTNVNFNLGLKWEF